MKSFQISFILIFIIWDWGFGIGDWGLGPIPNPQSPIPNPQSPIPNNIKHYIIFYSNLNQKIKIKKKFKKNVF